MHWQIWLPPVAGGFGKARAFCWAHPELPVSPPCWSAGGGAAGLRHQRLGVFSVALRWAQFPRTWKMFNTTKCCAKLWKAFVPFHIPVLLSVSLRRFSFPGSSGWSPEARSISPGQTSQLRGHGCNRALAAAGIVRDAAQAHGWSAKPSKAFTRNPAGLAGPLHRPRLTGGAAQHCRTFQGLSGDPALPCAYCVHLQ